MWYRFWLKQGSSTFTLRLPKEPHGWRQRADKHWKKQLLHCGMRVIDKNTIESQDNPDATVKDTRAAAAEGECEWSLELLQGEST